MHAHKADMKHKSNWMLDYYCQPIVITLKLEVVAIFFHDSIKIKDGVK